jgi:hypothetical protein
MNPKVPKFNKMFLLSFILHLIGAVPNTAYPPFRYRNDLLYPEYNIQFPDGSWHRVLVQIRLDGGLMITNPYGRILSNTFECYRHFCCGDNYELALDWENNPLLFNVQKIPPRINIDKIIDGSGNFPRYIDLLYFVNSPKSRVKSIAQHLSKVCNLPLNTVFLLLLGCFSAMTSKRFNCAYQDGKKVSIGLFIVAEQSSGMSKSRFLEICTDPMVKKISGKVKTLRSMIDDANEDLLDFLEIGKKDDVYAQSLRRKIRALDKELLETQSLMPLTDPTPESLDDLLNITHGTFSAISSEQGLPNSLFGLSNGKKVHNFDILLNARDGGNVNSSRVGRKGYCGPVSGVIISYPQEGAVLKIISASLERGAFERCLSIAEPDMAGTRDHKNTPQPNLEFTEDYENQCQFFDEVLNKQFDHDRLITLKISEYDWDSIYHFQNLLEGKLGIGGEYSHPIMKRFISKSRLHIIGISSNLCLFDMNPDEMPSDCSEEFYIPSMYIRMAISMMGNIIEYLYCFCLCNGIINNNEQLKVVYDLFSKHGALSLHEIKKKCDGIKPFKDLPNSRTAVENVVRYLAQNYVLLPTDDNIYTKNPEPYRVTGI